MSSPYRARKLRPLTGDRERKGNQVSDFKTDVILSENKLRRCLPIERSFTSYSLPQNQQHALRLIRMGHGMPRLVLPITLCCPTVLPDNARLYPFLLRSLPVLKLDSQVKTLHRWALGAKQNGANSIRRIMNWRLDMSGDDMNELMNDLGSKAVCPAFIWQPRIQCCACSSSGMACLIGSTGPPIGLEQGAVSITCLGCIAQNTPCRFHLSFDRGDHEETWPDIDIYARPMVDSTHPIRLEETIWWDKDGTCIRIPHSFPAGWAQQQWLRLNDIEEHG
ncbi:hypothetical protein BD324DRAFT_654210 [Kockovaella imperatae]|uniref:Uncharacterized protein n=1 Tax=Kockovaella imperatae TaxID=4999 RepID=A0A1Y1U8D1_9TREE|nr:hypothetical protein BD324DRAFT_654210 [Kockovaella imperatae]ORX33375.1 hypothetical protein BD324DRAFT_654210 [Kockovaella imperatae]